MNFYKHFIYIFINIVLQAVELLKPGGVLVYSTCTITVDENEGLVEWALSTFPHMQLGEQVCDFVK